MGMEAYRIIECAKNVCALWIEMELIYGDWHTFCLENENMYV